MHSAKCSWKLSIQFLLKPNTHEHQTLQTLPKMSISWKKGNKKTNKIRWCWNAIISEIRFLLGVSCANITHLSRPDQPAQGRGKKTQEPQQTSKSKKTHWNLEFTIFLLNKSIIVVKVISLNRLMGYKFHLKQIPLAWVKALQKIIFHLLKFKLSLFSRKQEINFRDIELPLLGH